MDSLLNLCPDDNNSYFPVPVPELLTPSEMTPLAVAGRSLFLGTNNNISALNTVSGTLTPVAAPSGVPICAAKAACGQVVVMTDGDDPVVVDTNTLQATSARRPKIAVRIFASDAGQTTMKVGAVPLSAEYGIGEVTDPDDCDALRTAVGEAYARVAADVRTFDALFQPVVVQAVITDPTGVVIYRGPRTLVDPYRDTNPTRSVLLGMTARNETAYTPLTISMYRLAAQITVADGTDLTGCTLTLMRSPQIHPCDPDAVSHGTVTVMRSGTSDTVMSVALQGSSNGLSDSADERTRRIVRRLVSHPSAVSYNMSVTLGTATDGVHNVSFDLVAPAFDYEKAAIGKLLTDNLITLNSDQLLRLRADAPHRFDAGVCTSAATIVGWGDVTLHRTPGFAVADFAATVDPDEAWSGTVTVTFADGTTARRTFAASGCMPLTLNPVLSYPDPDARHIRIVVEPDTGGSSPMVWDADLQPDEIGASAVAISPYARPRVAVEDTTAWIVDMSDVAPAVLRCPSAVLVASSFSPLSPTAASTLDDRITALAAASSSSGAWDYGRTRFYAFTATRAVLLNVAAGHKSIAAGVIAHVGAANFASVTSTAAGSVCFVAGRGVYRIDGSRVSVVTLLDTDVDRIGYDTRRAEIVAAASSGDGTVYHIDPDKKCVVFATTSPGASNAWLSTDSGVFVESQSGVMNIAVDACRAVSTPVNVAMTTAVRLPLSAGRRTIRQVLWNVDAAMFDGSLTVKRAYLDSRRALVSRLDINGRISAPLPLKIVSHCLTSAVLELTGTVSVDARIALPQIFTA